MGEQDISMHEASRQAIYASLAKCFRLPEPELLPVLKTVTQELEKLDSRAANYTASMCKTIIASERLEHLKVEFAALFIGPYSLPAPPYGSVYLDKQHRIMGDSTIDVLKFYKAAGLEPAPTHKDAPDHIATELEFMSFLVTEEIKALANGDNDRFLDLLETQKTFLSSHLGLWVEGFAQAVKNSARTDFYIDLVEATKILITEEADHLLNLQ